MLRSAGQGVAECFEVRLNDSSHVINRVNEANTIRLVAASPDSGFVILNSCFSLALALSFAFSYLLGSG